jgi:hypothetical protein
MVKVKVKVKVREKEKVRGRGKVREKGKVRVKAKAREMEKERGMVKEEWRGGRGPLHWGAGRRVRCEEKGRWRICLGRRRGLRCPVM